MLFVGEEKESSSTRSPNIENTPIEPYKKVKLKRSHILKKLTSVSPPSVAIPTSVAIPATVATSSTVVKEDVTSVEDTLKIDIPEDVTSSTPDSEIIEQSSNSDNTNSPTPRKKVKLIRNNPRIRTPQMQAPMPPKKEESIIDAPVSTITVSTVDSSDNSRFMDNDVSDVIAQIDQIIGMDNVSLNEDSGNLLSFDDLNLGEDSMSTKAISFDEESNDLLKLSGHPVEKTDSNDALMKIVEDLNEVCSATVANIISEQTDPDISTENIDIAPELIENVVTTKLPEEVFENLEADSVSTEIVSEKVDEIFEEIQNTVVEDIEMPLTLETGVVHDVSGSAVDDKAMETESLVPMEVKSIPGQNN